MVVWFGVQFAVSVTLPSVERRFLKYTLPEGPFAHFVLALEIEVEGLDVVPHFAVEVSSPLDTVHPVNVESDFDGAEA